MVEKSMTAVDRYRYRRLRFGFSPSYRELVNVRNQSRVKGEGLFGYKRERSHATSHERCEGWV